MELDKGKNLGLLKQIWLKRDSQELRLRPCEKGKLLSFRILEEETLRTGLHFSEEAQVSSGNKNRNVKRAGNWNVLLLYYKELSLSVPERHSNMLKERYT